MGKGRGWRAQGYSTAKPETDGLYHHEDYDRKGLEHVPGTITYKELPGRG